MKNSNVIYETNPKTTLWIVRLGRIILFLLTLFISLKVSAQDSKVSIQMNDTTIEAIIEAIRLQTEASFIYNHEELLKCGNTSVNVVNVSIEQALTECLKNTCIDFQKINSNYVLTPRKVKSELYIPEPEIKTQTVRGRVVDRDGEYGLPSANVIVLGTNPLKGTISDNDGYFKITDLPIGRYTLKVSYLGYEEAVLPEILVSSAKESILNIELTEKTANLEEVVVSVKKGEALNEMATVSSRSFSVEETKRYAASISDPSRMALTFAGVSSGSDDLSNEIIVRGNSPYWMHWRLEGVEIPSPNHLAEESFSSGSVSILSINMIGKSDFYTGAFPAEYGGALSGVFDIKLRNGNNEKREYNFQAGFLGLEASAEGPFKKGYRGSYLINYRYSTLAILTDLNVVDEDAGAPIWQDLSFKVNLPTKKAGTFSLWGIGGISGYQDVYGADSTFGEEIRFGYADKTSSGMHATGIGHTVFLGKKSYLKSVLAHSGSFSSQDFQVADSLGVLNGDYFDDLQHAALRFNSFFNTKISSKLTLRTGFTYNQLNYQYLIKEFDSLNVWQTYVDGKGTTEIYDAYTQGKYKFTDNIVFTAGLHYTYFALSKDSYLEPRLGLSIKLPKDQKLGFGYGHHSKNESLPVFFTSYIDENNEKHFPNKTLGLTQSVHYVVSYEKLLGKNLGLKAEVYYQQINKLPASVDPKDTDIPAFSISLQDSLGNIGEGKNYGLELTLQKYFTNQYYFMVTSSLFESKYKPANGEWYNSKYNYNYINNVVVGKEFDWGTNKMLSVNAKLLWSGGKRLVPVDIDASRKSGQNEYNWDAIYSQKAKDYFRLDLGFRLHFRKEHSEHILMLDIQNATNRMNISGQFYDVDEDKIVKYPMTGIIPILSYRIEF